MEYSGEMTLAMLAMLLVPSHYGPNATSCWNGKVDAKCKHGMVGRKAAGMLKT